MPDGAAGQVPGLWCTRTLSEAAIRGHNGSSQSDMSPVTLPDLAQPACTKQETNGQHCSVLCNSVFKKQPDQGVVIALFYGHAVVTEDAVLRVPALLPVACND